MVQWRKNTTVVHKGELMQFIPFNNVYVYFRYTNEKIIMVIINNNTENQKIDVARFKEGIKDFKVGTDIITDTNVDITEDFVIPTKTSMILELK